MTTILIGLGFILIFEGLVLALAPGILEMLSRVLGEISTEQRRTFGLGAAALGVFLLWLALG